MKIHRGGRPKLNRPLTDTGTPELVKKRVRLVDGGDPSMSTTPLGVYLERGLLHDTYAMARKMYEAGMNYRYCYGIVFGRSSVRAITDQPSGRTEVDDDLLEKIEPEYWRATKMLLRTRPVFAATWKICITDEFGDSKQLAALKTGLTWLVRA